jgi:hypothetical protein
VISWSMVLQDWLRVKLRRKHRLLVKSRFGSKKRDLPAFLTIESETDLREALNQNFMPNSGLVKKSTC